MRIPYPGTLSEEIIESGEPAIMTEIGAIGEHRAPYLRKSCRGCTGLVIALGSGRQMLGALILLRGPQQSSFSAEESGYASSLGDSIPQLIWMARSR